MLLATSSFLVKKHWPLLLALSAIFLQPFGRSVELAVLVMMVIGGVDLIKNRNNIWKKSSFLIFGVLFLCFWIPSLVSLIDAVNISKSSVTTFGMLRFYLAGVFVISRLSSPQTIRLLVLGISVIATLWSLDNLLQAITGFDIFGRPPIAGRIPGIFGDSPRSGWMLIPLISVAVLYIATLGRLWLSATLAFLMAGAIFISGDRGAWVALFWIFLSLCCFLFISGKGFKKRVVVSLAVVAFLISAGVSQVPEVQSRMVLTYSAMGGGFEAWDAATSKRLTIWVTAFEVIKDNPVNGIGVRGFRYAYPDYAPEDDFFVKDGVGPHHSHQIVVEMLSDAGVIGLVGYILSLICCVWLVREAIRRKTYLALGFLASVIGVLMPINSHLSFYSSYWAQACWLLFAFAVVAVFHERADKEEYS